MYHPFEAETTKMTDKEFEKYVFNIIKKMTESEKLNVIEIKHNYIAEVDDGNY